MFSSFEFRIIKEVRIVRSMWILTLRAVGDVVLRLSQRRIQQVSIRGRLRKRRESLFTFLSRRSPLREAPRALAVVIDLVDEDKLDFPCTAKEAGWSTDCCDRCRFDRSPTSSEKTITGYPCGYSQTIIHSCGSETQTSSMIRFSQIRTPAVEREFSSITLLLWSFSFECNCDVSVSLEKSSRLDFSPPFSRFPWRLDH